MVRLRGRWCPREAEGRPSREPGRAWTGLAAGSKTPAADPSPWLPPSSGQDLPQASSTSIFSHTTIPFSHAPPSPRLCTLGPMSLALFTPEPASASSPAALPPWSPVRTAKPSFTTLSSPSKLKPAAYATHIETGESSVRASSVECKLRAAMLTWLVGLGSAVESDLASQPPSPTNSLGLIFSAAALDTPPFDDIRDSFLSQAVARSLLFGGGAQGGLPSPPADEFKADLSPAHKEPVDAVEGTFQDPRLFDSPELIPIPILDSSELELFPFELSTPPSSPSSPTFLCEGFVPPPAPRLRPKELPTLTADDRISRSPSSGDLL